MAAAPSPSKVKDIDQQTAQRLFREGATLVFMDVPPGTEFGMDYNSWTVGEKFRGVKMIPPGIHFIYYSAVGTDGQPAPRTGFFHNFHQGEVLVKKWDKQAEDIKTEVISEEEQRAVGDSKESLDIYLGVYPYDTYKKWVSLTSYVTPAVVSRLSPSCGQIFAVTQLLSEGSTTESRKMAQASASTATNPPQGKLPDMKEVPGTSIPFTVIPVKKYPDGASPAQMTKYSMDHSHVLKTLLNADTFSNPVDLLGELQFAFVVFLIGQVYGGFEQWKQLVNLMSSCEEAVACYGELFEGFITVMYHQVQEIPEDFFVDIVSQNNFLTTTLRSFFSNLRESDCEDKLKTKGRKFQENLEKKFKWDFSAEDEDDAPVVVM